MPARNAAALLPAWLDSVSKYADRVIALDDGSTDGTRRILQAHPLVTAVLTNPVRQTYHGWDDLGNRQRLVYAALAHGAAWLLFLDADEHFDDADGTALRRLISLDAQPGFAYGFESFRLAEDDFHFDPRSLWVYRLFHARDAVSPLGSKRLHFVPIPSGIPRERWLHTSLRMRHSGSLTREHRESRFAKYGEADPEHRWQRDYTNLLEDPPVVLPWSTRAATTPLLLGPAGRFADHVAADFDAPALSVVVIAQNDADVIDSVVSAAVSQAVADDFEVILVGSGSDDTVSKIRSRFASVRTVQLPRRVLPGEARNAGLWMARGEYITFPGSHVELLPGSLQARLDAHEQGWEMVVGSVANGNFTRAGWASYFLDHASVTRARQPGPHRTVPGAASYVVSQVRAVGGFPEDMRAGEDTVVNRTLLLQGKRTYFCPDAAFVHTSRATTVAGMLRHHFQRGRGLARITRSSQPELSRRALVKQMLRVPRRRLRRVTKSVATVDAETQRQYRKVRPAITAGAFAAAAGACVEAIVPAVVASTAQSARSPQVMGAGPLLAIGGRKTGPAASGLLSAGSARQSAQRLETFAAYAATICPVSVALAPIVTSATVTHELNGTSTLHTDEATVESCYQACKSVGGRLILQLQPGREELAALLGHWKHWLVRPDVDVLFDLREQVAFAGQHMQLDEAVELARRIGGPDTATLTRSVTHTGTVEATFFDLRQPGTPWPHEALALARSPRPTALVYQ